MHTEATRMSRHGLFLLASVTLALAPSSDAGGFGTGLELVEDLDGDGTPDLVIADSTARGDGQATASLIVYSLGKRACIQVIDSDVSISGSSAPFDSLAGGSHSGPNLVYVGRVGEQAYVITVSISSGEEKSRFAVGRPGHSVGWGEGGPSLWILGAADASAEKSILLRHCSVGAENYYRAQVISLESGKVLRTLEGTFIGCVGDVDRDGTLDYVVSLRKFHSLRSGKTGKELLQISKTDKGERGDTWALEEHFPCIDSNGDGTTDVVQLVTWTEDEPASPVEYRLSIRVMSGKDGSEILDLGTVVTGYKASGNVCMIGDQNEDGRRDLMLSWVDGFQASGGMKLYSCANGKLISQQKWTRQSGGSMLNEYGYSNSEAGDLDGDGSVDVAISLTGWKGDNSSLQRLFLLSPKSGLIAEVNDKTAAKCRDEE